VSLCQWCIEASAQAEQTHADGKFYLVVLRGRSASFIRPIYSVRRSYCVYGPNKTCKHCLTFTVNQSVRQFLNTWCIFFAKQRTKAASQTRAETGVNIALTVNFIGCIIASLSLSCRPAVAKRDRGSPRRPSGLPRCRRRVLPVAITYRQCALLVYYRSEGMAYV